MISRQGAELVHQNSIFLERLHTLGEWGLEYDALDDARGGDRRSKDFKTDTRVSFENARRDAGARAGRG
jgi:hypothetical protein